MYSYYAESLKAFLGTGDMVNPIMYTLGLVPVYKVQLENPAALWKRWMSKSNWRAFNMNL